MVGGLVCLSVSGVPYEVEGQAGRQGGYVWGWWVRFTSGLLSPRQLEAPTPCRWDSSAGLA